MEYFKPLMTWLLRNKIKDARSVGTSIGREAHTSDDVRLHIEHAAKSVLSKPDICG